MADGQSLFSRSEADRMLIGLELLSQSDMVSDGATNETNGDSVRSPAKQGVGSPSSRSEQPGDGLLTEGEGDLVENVGYGSERSDGGDISLSANCDCDGAEENQAEDDPCSVQGEDEEDSRGVDGDAEKRLDAEDEAEDNAAGETEGVSGENLRGDGEVVAQTVMSSIEPGELDLHNVIGDDQDAVPQREVCSLGRGDLGEESENSKTGLGAKTCLERSDTLQMESDGEPASLSMTRSPECSIPFELSETFLDNMNPQDDSQDLEEEEARGMEEEEQKAAEEAVKEDVGGQESSFVFESQSRTPEHSLNFELSETFLDNLNPQDDSQDFGEVCEENGADDEPKAAEVESKDNAESVVLERTDSASEDQVASSLQRDETMELDGDNVLEAVSHGTASSPEPSLPFELSETFLDNLNPQDDSQDLREVMEEKDSYRSFSNTNNEDVPSSLDREESVGEEALSHIPSDAAGNDEPVSPTEQNANTEEMSSPNQPQIPADETPSLQAHQDATSCEAACLTTQQGSAVDEVSSPSTGIDTAEDKATFAQDDPQDGDDKDKERDRDQVMTDDEVSSLHAHKHVAASDNAAVESAAAEESSSSDQNIPPEEVLSPSVGKDASPAEDNASEGGSPKVEAHGDISDELTTIQDAKDDSSPSAVDAEKACVGPEEATEDSPKEELQASPSCEEEGKEEESSANVEEEEEDDNTREEGEYSSSPSSSPEHGEIQDENTSDVLQLSASDDVDVREEGTNKRRGKDKNSRAFRNARPQGKVCGESSRENHHRNRDDLNEAVVVNSDCEDDFRNFQDKLKKEKPEKEDENSASNGNVDSSVRDDSDAAGAFSQEPSSKESPAVGAAVVTESGDGENGGEEGERTLVDNDDNSDDDVQIIEGPPQEPIDTLIVDDDDDDDVVPSSNVTSKTPVSESSRTSKKKRTVEQDGHDLRIVIRDERREKEDSDRRHRRHERERREERRSHSHRRSESDRKSSDRSARRRHHRSRSHSRERRRRRSRSRSHSRDRTSRRRHPRERSRDKSAERERSSHRKRRRDRSREHRHRSRSRSHSPKHSREDSWDKENRDDRENSRSKRRRYHRDGDKSRESQEEERSTSKHQDLALSSKHSRTSRPSNNFTKDSSGSSSAAEKSDDDDDSEGSVKEVVQNAGPSVQSNVPADKPDKQEEDSKKETEVIPVEIPIPEPRDIPIPKPEDIPIPETEHIPVPPPFSMPVPQPELIQGPPVFSVILPPHPIFENPPLPPPEEEPRENPPEPPPLPPRWPEVLPTKGEGLLPTPIRRKAALEEAAAVYDPAHPTDDDGERFRFPGVPNAAHPPPELLAGPPPPRLPGQMLADGTFVPAPPGEGGGLLGPPPQRVSLQPVRFGPPRPVLVNHVVMERPPFSNGPFPGQLAGPPLPPPRFPMEIGGPGGVVPLQGQFGQGPPPPGPLPPPQGFPGQLGDRFEDGPPVGQFPVVSVPSGVPEMANMAAPPPSLRPPPPDIHLLAHPPPHDLPVSEKPGVVDDGFDKTLVKLVMGPNLVLMKERKPAEEESASVPALFKVPPPRLALQQARSPHGILPSAEAAMSVEQLEDSTEVMDMDMSPLEGDCELRMSSPPEEEAEAGGGGGEQDKGKKVKPLAAIDLRAISNAILQLTSAATDDVPASAVELTNKEKYMKKLHLQERVVDEVKQALRPFYIYKKINKEEYKTILRKAVPKVCHSKSGDINPQKIQQLVEGYVDKFNKQRQHTEQKVKPPAKPASPKEKGKANGERAKPAR